MRRRRTLTKREAQAKCLTDVNAALVKYYQHETVSMRDLNKMLAMIVALHSPMALTVSLTAGTVVD